MTDEQKAAIIALSNALREATDTGALDELQGYCGSPDSINDVCDAVTKMVLDEC